MSLLYQTTTLLLCLFSLSYVKTEYTCYSEDFTGGSLNILNGLCDVLKLPFSVERYDKFEDTFEKPIGSNSSYFITPNSYSENGSCIETLASIFVTNNSRLFIDYYVSNPNTLQYFNWIVQDADTGKNIKNVPMSIDNRHWAINTFITITQDANIKMRIETHNSSRYSFFAIDKFRIMSPNQQECNVFLPTPPTEEPTDPTVEPTATTEGFTDPMETSTIGSSSTSSPSPSPSPPGPDPSPSSCVCNCNCDYESYCKH